MKNLKWEMENGKWKKENIQNYTKSPKIAKDL